MSTIQGTPVNQIKKDNPLFSNFRAIIETSFYGNHVQKITGIDEAYELAKNAPGTIITDIPVYQAENLGIPSDAKVLVNNDGKIVGRTAAARRIIGQPGIDDKLYSDILREAVFQGTKQEYYHGEVVVGLHEDFMMRSHVMMPKGFELDFYSYLLNFQIMNQEYQELYSHSKAYQEGDVYIYGDPNWSHPDFPLGLVVFDPHHNVAAILGLRYFGEFKKATLTLSWATAHRNGFIACHGGMKQYQLANRKFTMAAFGLSGSGKSTITLAKHGNKYDVVVLHDDAFVIDKEQGKTTALEPAYFDKTQDYPMDHEAVKYFLTCQNVGVTLDDAGNKVLVTEDIRNGNGRTVKSRFVTPNRVDHLDEKIDAVFWIMKDDSLPPIVRIDDPVLAAVFGVTLATKRSTAENVAPGTDLDSLVIEPFANPFRCYPLAEDYQDFRNLFSGQETACYILNTGFFNGNKVTPADTLGSIEAIVEDQANFQDFGPMTAMSYLPVEGHEPNFHDQEYITKLRKGMENRLRFIQEMREENEGYNALPEETSLLIQHLILELENVQD
ncbi:phosphoenolpyruvate carboxykinase (ATP) [Enterococcus sp. PF1-24]|uniref:phosphoenolpyruvate carboxykinase (ATP) n=1 Tax=unclassified Enterococcus TaxID=2608891 RepID=UPI00247685D0|nr:MULTISPECIES: phosphoenolpyruvate carboxykinase (ATP) [unclassified Enterococcus]MDH6364161.1 phosphoenolpyruvate carboxykinase (ATP) [Enterococcus sp. PFB1-1]MDH6401262.1 phosphoenolpyruvate carboxykinase (ATP) [Enterococcus sp. PF1-24]